VIGNAAHRWLSAQAQVRGERAFAIDAGELAKARFDGIFVLRSNTDP